MKSNKKYRFKDTKAEVTVLTEHGPDPLRPVVFAYKEFSALRSVVYQDTRPLTDLLCIIEEVPEEPIGVGYSWTKNGRLYKVVYRLQGAGEHYVVVAHPEDGEAELVENASDGFSFWCVDDIRQASEQ